MRWIIQCLHKIKNRSAYLKPRNNKHLNAASKEKPSNALMTQGILQLATYQPAYTASLVCYKTRKVPNT